MTTSEEDRLNHQIAKLDAENARLQKRVGELELDLRWSERQHDTLQKRCAELERIPAWSESELCKRQEKRIAELERQVEEWREKAMELPDPEKNE